MIEVRIPEEKINEIDKKLQEVQEKTPNELKKVVNASAKEARKELAKEVQKRYASKKYNAKGIREQISIENATVGKVEARLKAKGEATELGDFKVSSMMPGARKMVRAKVLRNGGMERLYDAFVVRFKSGHVAVVERAHGKYMKAAKKKNKHWEKLEKKLSPSVPQMIGQAYDKGDVDLQQTLYKKLEEHIGAVLGGTE